MMYMLAAAHHASPAARGAVDAGAGVIALSIAFVPHWKQKLSKTAACLFLIGGLGLGAAFIGGLARSAADGIASLSSDLTATVIMAASGIILFSIVAHDLWKGHKASRMTAYAAFFLPLFAVAIHGHFGDAFNHLLNSVGHSAGDLFYSELGVK